MRREKKDDSDENNNEEEELEETRDERPKMQMYREIRGKLGEKK